MAKSSQSSKSGGDNFTRWLVIGMVALVVITGVVFSLLSQKNENSAALIGLNDFKVGAPISSSIDIENGSAIVLNPGRAKVIDIWADPQCPVCKLFEIANGDYVDNLVRTNAATVRFHLLSFLGDESVRAANAAFCAADENQYLDFHKALYLVQSSVENSGFWSNETLLDIGSRIGIKSKVFQDCVTKGSKVDLVKANYDSMEKFGVKGTPTVFINGKLWERKSNDFNLAEFSAAVEQG